MAISRGIKNACLLLWKRDWREFMIRLRISLGHVDLKHDPTETDTERTHYYADSGGLEFDKIFDGFGITAEDAIVDFGCGKGGVLISLSKFPFAKIVGVEIDPELIDIANRNLRRLRINNVTVECCDAAAFKPLEEFNYFYFFDPFPCVVMRDVLKNIEQSLLARPRKVTLIYLNPSCRALVESSDVFTKIKKLKHFQHDCFIYTNINK